MAETTTSKERQEQSATTRFLMGPATAATTLRKRIFNILAVATLLYWNVGHVVRLSFVPDKNPHHTVARKKSSNSTLLASEPLPLSSNKQEGSFTTSWQYCQQQQQQEEQPEKQSNATAGIDSVCKCFLPEILASSPSVQFTTPAFSLWRRFQEQTQRSARESLDSCWNWPGALDNLDEGNFTQLTTNMFSALNSYRLSKSIKTKASPLIMERVLEILLKRIQDPANHSPLKIAVFGGSVTMGFDAAANFLGLDQLQRRAMSGCTWPMKMQTLLNNILGNGTVVVRNYGVGGTDSSMGHTLLEYGMWTDGTLRANEIDIFISAYGPNDAQAPIQTREHIYESMQNFVRLCMNQRPCRDLPLVILLDDVVLDHIPKGMVRQGLRYSREMIETANWASTMSVSYADATREMLYADPNDHTLNDFGALHPGLTFHTGLAWLMAYNLLHGLLDACDASSLPEHGQDEPRNGYPLPVLRDSLNSNDIPDLWKKESAEMTKLCETNRTDTSCIYKWVASYQNARTKQLVQEAISRHATNIEGWQAVGFPIRKPRRTWSVQGVNSTFTLQFDEIESPVNKMLILYLRSYGRVWQGSKLHVTLDARRSVATEDWKTLADFHLEGVHDSETSINYSHHVDLGDAIPVGSFLRATFTVVGGTAFQVNGLALCHSHRTL